MDDRNSPVSSSVGKRFLVLKVRRVGGREVLSLFDEHNGTVALPREWSRSEVGMPCSFIHPNLKAGGPERNRFTRAWTDLGWLIKS